MSCDLSYLRPPNGDAVHAADCASLFGFTPAVPALVRAMWVWGFVLCSGQVFRRKETLLARSGRPPTAEESEEAARHIVRPTSLEVKARYDRAVQDLALPVAARLNGPIALSHVRKIEASGDAELIDEARSGRLSWRAAAEMAEEGLSTEEGGGLE